MGMMAMSGRLKQTYHLQKAGDNIVLPKDAEFIREDIDLRNRLI